MKINFTRTHEDARSPKKSRPFDAMFDLTALSYATEYEAGEFVSHVYGTGVCVEIPEGYVGLVFPRSSISRTKARLANSVGVIDPNYRGEIIFKFKGPTPPYKEGDRIGQICILPLPEVEWEEAQSLSPSPDDRGTQGYGSSDLPHPT